MRAELRLLENDPSRTGEVHRLAERGFDAEGIARELGVGSSSFVWGYALLDGDLPTANSAAGPGARHVFEVNPAELDRRANDEVARVVEVERAEEQADEAEARNEVGSYVYALPHYLRCPFDAVSGRTLMKVGRSDAGVIQRFRQRTRTTALRGWPNPRRPGLECAHRQ